MFRTSGMTSGSPCINEAPKKSGCSNCNSTKLLIFVLFVLYAVCQVQILVNRERSVDVANILREIQQANERIVEIELSLAKVESSLDFLHAECDTKATAHKRAKRQSSSKSSVRQKMRKIRWYLKNLQHRVQCTESDNGKDSRGKLCHTGRGVKTGFLKDKRKGAETNSSNNPTQKTTSKYQTKASRDTTSPRVSSQTDSRTTKRRFRTIYTVWGNSTCRDDVTKVYSGRVASLHSGSNPSVGSEYLCIPDRLVYTKHENLTSGLYLSPVKYGANMNIFMKFTEEQCKLYGTAICNNLKVNHAHLFRKLDYFQVPCVVCLREKRTATLLMPGRNICQSGWWKEYIGFLMTQQHGDARSQHICVIADAQGVPGSNTTGATGPLLQPVAYKCTGPSCPANYGSSSYKPRALSCAVCSI